MILPTLRSCYDERSDEAFLLETLGKLWITGYAVDWSSFYGEERRQRIPLPTYPFERQRVWLDAPPNRQAPAYQTVNRGKKFAMSDCFYEPVWQASALLIEGQDQGGTWLVFEDSFGLGTAIRKHLQQSGASVIRVRVGDLFEQLGPDLFTVRPDVPSDYLALFAVLKQSRRLPDRVIHLWSLDSPEEQDMTAAVFRPAQRLGFYSLLFCTQALAHQGTAPVRITVITNHTLLVDSDFDPA